MVLTSSLGTGLAWDNFDRFLETCSGKDTLHDTVGIAYQFGCFEGVQPLSPNSFQENPIDANRNEDQNLKIKRERLQEFHQRRKPCTTYKRIF